MSSADAAATRVRQRERLVAALRTRGVDYLAPSDAAGEPLADEALIASLAAHDDPRLRQALIALFMLHPELAPLVPPLCARLAPPAVVELQAHYLAAVYLQSMWRIRLDHYWPPTPDLPDYFSASLGLPSALDEFGKAGLYALADWHAAHVPWRANHLSEYEGVAELLLADIQLKARPVRTGHARIDVFLAELGKRCRQPVRLYVVDISPSALELIRQQVFDLDIAIDVSASIRGELIPILREIKDVLGLYLNEASPGDFIPLPAGYAGRHEFIGRFGRVDVFHFDWYSTVLSRIARCRRQDLLDVIALLQHERVEWSRLEAMFHEILPLMGKKSLRQKPGEFALNFGALAALWQSAGGTL